jgi:starch-binding outer membrane protein, SusD/RagB family
MIRFGKFEAAGTAKAASQPFRRIYPIPQSAMDASKTFTQNDKY